LLTVFGSRTVGSIRTLTSLYFALTF